MGRNRLEKESNILPFFWALNGDNDGITRNIERMIMDDNNLKDFLTANEVSECLRIPLNTIYRLTKQGVINGVKVGKQWRYNKHDLEKYLAGEVDSRNAHLERFKERRAYPRINCNFKCKSEVNIEGIKDFWITDSYIANISAGGVFMHFCDKNNMNLINLGDPIDVNFDLASDLDGTVNNIHAKGRIVRKAYEGVGIKFRHIDDRHKNVIVDYVD